MTTPTFLSATLIIKLLAGSRRELIVLAIIGKLSKRGGTRLSGEERSSLRLS
jgi:hypothetical protein